MAGVSLGVRGLVVVALGTGGHVRPLALALCLLAGLSWGIGNVVSRAAKAPGGLALTVWSATVVPLPMLGLSLLIDGPAAVGHGLANLGWHGVLSTAYTAGLCSLVGYAVFNRLLSRYPSGQVVPWVLLAPVVAMASAWALLGEAPGTGRAGRRRPARGRRPHRPGRHPASPPRERGPGAGTTGR